MTFFRGSTASNANSRLLRLPQELKDQIYELVLGEQLIHVHFDLSEERHSYRLCQANNSEREAQNIFAKSEGIWSAVELMDRHELCYDVKSIYQDCECFARQNDHVYEPHLGLDVALPTCCRQIYQDVHSLIYSASTWSFRLPPAYHALRVNKDSVSRRAQFFFVHRLHLDILVDDRIDEIKWNSSFGHIAAAFKSLRYFYADIESRSMEIHTLKKWHFQNPADCTFLQDLSALRVLKLRAVAITVADDHILHCITSKSYKNKVRQYRWSMAQKQAWAAYIMRVLLRQKEPKYVVGEKI